jgi:predicted metalloprotease
MRITVWSAAAAVVVLLAGCGAPKPQLPTAKQESKPDTSTIQIHGDDSNPVNKLAMEAIADLQSFWGKQYPDLYGGEYKPVDGGFFAVMPSTDTQFPCEASAEEIAGNAFYCPSGDLVAWDAESLLPELREKYGDFTIPVVLAHEWGHAIQQRSNFTARTVTKELQADCFAGAWAKHAQDDKVFDVSAKDLDGALAGILDVRDTPGKDKADPDAHGSGFDRVGAFQDGYENGLSRCKDYRDEEPPVIELPFNDAADAAAGGDAPYDTVVNSVPYDLEDYWTRAYPQIADGQPWQPVKGLEPFSPGNAPKCGDQSTDGYVLFYCVPDDYVGWDNAEAMPEVYKQGGDWAVATLLATQYGLAALTRLGDQSDEKTSTLRGDCLAGAYTASVINFDRQDTSTLHISPGDLDEGIKALLVFRGEGDAERQGAGFGRVLAFREGALKGPDPCPSYQGQ